MIKFFKFNHKMDHPDIIRYLSDFLDSKSLAMISNTNYTNYNICDNVYKNRTLDEHVLSMINILRIDYKCQLKNKIVLNDHYDGYIKQNELFYNCTSFKTENIKIRFFPKVVTIYSIYLLTPELIHEINNTFNIELIDINFQLIRTYKSNLNIENTEKALKNHGMWDEHCYIYKCKISKINITFHRQTLSMKTFTMDQTFDLCKKLL
jgi:hypothetical protein